MTADAVGGVWTYALALARALDHFAVELTLVCFGPPPRPDQLELAGQISNLSVLTRALALEWMDDPWADVDAGGEWLLALERELEPDVVHINGFAHAALDFRAPVLAVAHSCVCTWWRAVHGCDAPPTWDEYRRRVAAGLAAAELVVAPTAASLAATVECHGDLRGRGRVVHNGRAIELPGEAEKQALVLSVGRVWDLAKNISSLERSAARLDWPVYTIGPGACDDRRGSAGEGVRALGPEREAVVIEWMQRAAIYCLPARYEPFGLSALEAAQAGCALVLGDIASLREVWADAALYVAPDDDAGLVAAIQGLIRDHDHRSELAARARARAARYRPEPMAAAYRALYDELTGRPTLLPTNEVTR
jgi:glycosyltransferase involved in cell wall biosynthesis